MNCRFPARSDPDTEATSGFPAPRALGRFQFRLRTLFLAVTVLCIFLAVPAAAWALGIVTAYVALSIVAVGTLVCVQAPIFLLFGAMGWLPSRDRRREGNPPPHHDAEIGTTKVTKRHED